ncbi:MAG: hypothetical protein HC830_02075 [Bacteroidetes bacterium]|nr:hypothetical protein [Bacteroidota bacterium]
MIFLLLFAVIIFGTSSQGLTQNRNDIDQWLNENQCSTSVRFTNHDFNFFSKPVCEIRESLKGEQPKQIKFMDGTWQVMVTAVSSKTSDDAIDFELKCTLESGISPQTSISVDFTFNNWSRSNYVLMPGATYNGNRFESRRIFYSPKLLDPRDIGPDKPPVISDIPRLNINDGPSRIQERSGSMSVPAIGFQSLETQTGFWLLTDQATKYGDTGIGIEESRDRKTAVISLTVPVVRENYQYIITDNQAPSVDKSPDFQPGDEVTLKFRVYFFRSSDIQGLFNRFMVIRNDLGAKITHTPFLPFRPAFRYRSRNLMSKTGWKRMDIIQLVCARTFCRIGKLAGPAA